MLDVLLKKCNKYVNNDDSFVFFLHHIEPNGNCCFDCSKYQKYTEKLKITTHDWLVIMQKPQYVMTNEDRKEVVLTNKNYAYFEASELKVIDILNIHNPTISIDFLVVQPVNVDPNSDLGKLLISSITHTYYVKGDTTYRFGLLNQEYRTDHLNPFLQPIGVPYFKKLERAFYNMDLPENYSGQWIEWDDVGQQVSKNDYLNGVIVK